MHYPCCNLSITMQGAIYVTSNGAMNWTAAVQETVDATLNRVISSGIRCEWHFFLAVMPPSFLLPLLRLDWFAGVQRRLLLRRLLF
jgi:hypothetical protein